MRIRVVSDIERLSRGLDDVARRQLPFAIARALTMTARDAQADVRATLPKRFTLRNNWVSSGIRITPARKGTPVAIVGSLEPFMQRQETGGTKTARSHSRVAVPVKAKRNKRDIIPKGQRPAALKGKPRTFMITRAGAAGIMQRVGHDRYPLQILYWLKRDVKVQPRFGFERITSNSVRSKFGDNFVQALDEAIKSAR